jgi:hypothetical protein
MGLPDVQDVQDDIESIIISEHRMPGGWYGPDGVAEALLASATFHAREALVTFTHDDERVVAAAMHCGIAAEHLAKSYLASLHPVLIVDGQHLDSLLVMTGHGARSRAQPAEVRTISFTKAYERVRQLLKPVFHCPPGELDFLGSVRNAAAHLAVADADGLRRAVRTLLDLTEPLLAAMNTDEARFWGNELAGLVATLRAEAAGETKQTVEAKMHAAQAGLRTRLAGLDAGQQILVLKALAGRPGWQADYEQRYPCPVCVQDGWLVCWLILDGDGQPADGPAPARPGAQMRHAVAHVHGFSCSACDLRLDGAA